MKNETNTTRPRKAVKGKARASMEQGLQEQQVAAVCERGGGDGYATFLAQKSIVAQPAGIKDPQGINEKLFPFQRACVEWALKRGRAALFEGTGLGKTIQQCEWANKVEQHTQKPVLILAPLAVSHQTVAEAKAMLGMEITFAEHGSVIGERGLELWSNPGDTILTPFMGIGSECYVAVEKDRKAIGIELKESYFKQAAGNLKVAEQKKKEMLLL